MTLGLRSVGICSLVGENSGRVAWCLFLQFQTYGAITMDSGRMGSGVPSTRPSALQLLVLGMLVTEKLKRVKNKAHLAWHGVSPLIFFIDSKF